MTSRADIIESHPTFPWLEAGDCVIVESFLRERGWIREDERADACGKAGDGNMNLTLRVRTNARSFILKQARPWVEKYDHIPAPWDRSLYEQGFYERVRAIPAVAAAMPALLASDSNARVLLLEDFGASNDFTPLYEGEAFSTADRAALAHYLASLHGHTCDNADPEFVNREMRLLNHEHIFVVPLAENNGLDLDVYEPGLNDVAAEIRDDDVFRGRVEESAARYLDDGRCLLHGDFFPGSWLRTERGVRIIDPEFCYYGDAEFDLGVCIAHLRLAELPKATATAFIDLYSAYTRDVKIDRGWIARYAGIEIMRRLLGVAQLPIAPSVDRRRIGLEASRSAVCTESIEALWP